MFQLSEIGALQETLMFLDGASHLPLLAIQVAEDEVNLEWIAGSVRRLGELRDRRIDLVRYQKIQAEHVMRRLARAPPIHPHAVLQLVSLPRLANRKAQQQRDEAGQENERAHHDSMKSAIARVHEP